MNLISWWKNRRCQKRAADRVASVLGGRSTKATDKWFNALPERGSIGRGNKYSAMMKVFGVKEEYADSH